MDTETVRMNITLPRDLVEALDILAGPRKRSQFISEAVKLRIKQFERERLESLLAEGYRASREESLKLSGEFEAADLEGWDEY